MNSTIHWGRVAVGAVLSELGVVIVLSLIIVVYRFIIAPGRSATDYQTFGEQAGYYIAPVAAAVAVFFATLWTTRTMASGFVANGTLVGVIAVILTLGFFLGAKSEHRLMYGVSFVLRVLAGYAGGLVAQRIYAGNVLPGVN